MAKVSPIQNSFSGGEFSPLFSARTDSPQYKIGLAKCLNYLPSIQGALIRRPGSYFVGKTAYPDTKKARLIPFIASNKQAYMLIFENAFFRVCKNDAYITVGGTPNLHVTPYLEADLPQIKYVQIADVMYLAHPNYPPQVITVDLATDYVWSCSALVNFDGPYMDVNDTGTTLATAPGGLTSGSETYTAGALTGINGGLGFLSTDVGRLIRLKDNLTGLWSCVKITSVTNTTHVVTSVVYGPTPTNPSHVGSTATWRLGAWSDTTGYPSCVVFHQGRLVFGGVRAFPQKIYGSVPDDFVNFQPTTVSGSVTDSHAYTYNFASSDVNALEWLISGFRGLYGGSNSAEWLVTPPTGASAITPTNAQVSQVTHYGSNTIQPLQVADAVIFVQRSSRKVRELGYVYTVDGYQAVDLNLIAEHATATGITEIAFQNEPQPILWCVREDGLLAAMTYERQLDALKVAWSRHQLGGISLNGNAIVESVATIPYSDGTRDEVWLIVKRVLNGAICRTIEVLNHPFVSTVDPQDAFFVDCGLTYDAPVTVTGATKAIPVVVTAAAHGFSNGDEVRFDNIPGMTQLNTNKYLISAVTTNTFALTGIDGSSFTTYITGATGEVRKTVTAVTGLGHLDGEYIQILADGAVHQGQYVVGGSVNLEISAAVVHVGLGFVSDAQMLRQDAGAQDGTAFGKTRRTHRVGFMLNRSLGLKFGTNFDEMDTVTFRTTADSMGRAPELFTGIITESLPADYDMDNQICWRQDQPLPSTILAVMPQLVTQDRG